MSKILDFLTLPLSLPISPILDFIICLAIGEVAYQIAYSVAGEHGHSGRERFLLHWLIRIPLYFLIWCIACLLIIIVDFIKAHWIYVLIALGVLLLIGITTLIIIKRKRKGDGHE